MARTAQTSRASAPAPAVAAQLARYAGLKDRLAGAGLTWLRDLREAAAQALAANGLPGPRTEAWRFTNLRPLHDLSFAEPVAIVGSEAERAALALLPALGRWRAVLVDGRFRADLSELDGLPEGLAVQPLASALHAGAAGLDGLLGTLARPDQEPMAALNTALMEDGVIVRVAPGVKVAERLEVVSIASAPAERAIAFHPRLLVTLGADASLIMVDTALGAGAAAYLNNPVAEVDLAPGASLDHVRVQDEGPAALHLATVYARVAERARYESFTLSLGARLARNEVHVTLAGADGDCSVHGAYLAHGQRHIDNTSIIRHAAPACRSRQVYKGVLKDQSHGVFQGKIEVDQIAQKTDGYQMNQAILLSPEAEVNSKPQLEIYADDVKCSHGATVGELDEAQLFYLRSRGVPAEEARAILVQAFFGDALEQVPDEGLREALSALIAGWWEREGVAG